MQVFRSVLGPLFIVAAIAAPLGAQQDKARDDRVDGVPRSAFPPLGMCRVWLNGVPQSQQPAATDCGSAVRNLPANARLLLGDVPGISATVKLRSDGVLLPRGVRAEARRTENARAVLLNVAPTGGAAPQNSDGVIPVTTRSESRVSPPPAKPGKPESFQY